MEKIPCKDCLCFPICKIQAVKYNVWKNGCVDLSVLDDKCEGFSKWYGARGFKNAGREVVNCFGAARSSWLMGRYI